MTPDWNEYISGFSERLRGLLPKTTKEINDLAYRHGLAGIRLDRVAQGKKGVDVPTLIRICDELGYSPTYLLFGKGPVTIREVDDNFLLVEMLQSEGHEQSGKIKLRGEVLRIVEKKLMEIRNAGQKKLLQTPASPAEKPSRRQG